MYAKVWHKVLSVKEVDRECLVLRFDHAQILRFRQRLSLWTIDVLYIYLYVLQWLSTMLEEYSVNWKFSSLANHINLNLKTHVFSDRVQAAGSLIKNQNG